jgi:hypothetical protein
VADILCLVAGSYQYLKEIPMLSDYEIHLSVGGFEEKYPSLTSERHPAAGRKEG